MPRQTKTFTKTIPGMTFTSDAYTDDGRVWRWVSNDAVCPLDACREYGIPCDVEAQKTARDIDIDIAIGRYKAAQARRTPEQVAEEQAQARAAFGSGREVVNVVTGEKYRT